MSDAGLKRGLDLIERDLGFGLEDHIVWDMGFLASRFIDRPI
jgi:hypothetical protein